MRIPFNASQRCSLGIEWELQLVDPVTRELTSGAVEILNDIRPEGLDDHPKAKHELLQSTIEVITGVCQSVSEARGDLNSTVGAIDEAARQLHLRLMCAGSHPISSWKQQKISPKPRYEEMVDRLQWTARRLQTFGVHVHIGVRSPEKAIPIVIALTSYLPYFLGLSASSPFWAGFDTGLASSRTTIFGQLPRSGMPPPMSDWAEFEDLMGTLIAAGSVDTVREVWWDVRPHPDFGTVELRVCDGIPTLDEVLAVAALSQCLVEQMDGMLDRGDTLPAPKPWLARENKWRAVRFGLDAEIIVDEAGTVVPLRHALLELVDELMPIARTLSCADELASIGAIVATGASYQRQRAVAEANGGDLTKVVDSLVDEMTTGLFV